MAPHRSVAAVALRPAAASQLSAAALLAVLLAPQAAAAAPPPPPPGAALLGGMVVSGVLVPAPAVRAVETAPLRPAPAAGSATPASAAPSSQQPAAATPGAASASTRELVLDRRQRQLLVIEKGQTLRRFPVAVGMPGWETPVGRFRVLEMQSDPVWEHPVSGARVPPGPDNPLGSRWIGFHRDCRGRSGFNGKEHLVVRGCVVSGFHGTPNRASIGRAVSHGCVRLFDEHVRDLYQLVRVGTPVTVLP